MAALDAGICPHSMTAEVLEYSTPPFAKSLRKDRYCGSVLATKKVLVQDFVHNLNCKSCPGTFVATKTFATVPVFPRGLCE